jgi:hypothetical protein
MPGAGANAALDRHNTELTIRALYIVLTLASTSEVAILGTTAIKNGWVHSATDIAANCPAGPSSTRRCPRPAGALGAPAVRGSFFCHFFSYNKPTTNY